MTRSCWHILLLACFALVASASYAEAPRQLLWADLVPKQAPSENPFAKLTRDQLQQLADVASVRDRKAQGSADIPALELENEQAVARKLAQEGIDVDGLLVKRKAMA